MAHGTRSTHQPGLPRPIRLRAPWISGRPDRGRSAANIPLRVGAGMAAQLRMEARSRSRLRIGGAGVIFVADGVAEAHESCELAAPSGRTAHVLLRPFHGVRLLLAELPATHAVTLLYGVARNGHFSESTPRSRLRGHAYGDRLTLFASVSPQ
jgi:hypothetical protein